MRRTTRTSSSSPFRLLLVVILSLLSVTIILRTVWLVTHTSNGRRHHPALRPETPVARHVAKRSASKDTIFVVLEVDCCSHDKHRHERKSSDTAHEASSYSVNEETPHRCIGLSLDVAKAPRTVELLRRRLGNWTRKLPSDQEDERDRHDEDDVEDDGTFRRKWDRKANYPHTKHKNKNLLSFEKVSCTVRNSSAKSNHKCTFYRNEAVPTGRSNPDGPPYGLLQGRLPALFGELPSKNAELAPLAYKGQKRTIRAGDIVLLQNSNGGDFMISLMNHDGWAHSFTVVGRVDDLALDWFQQSGDSEVAAAQFGRHLCKQELVEVQKENPAKDRDWMEQLAAKENDESASGHTDLQGHQRVVNSLSGMSAVNAIVAEPHATKTHPQYEDEVDES